MQKLLSLPPNLIDSFHQLEEVNHTDWFCTSDPVGSKLGSGGGTTWLLQACHQAFAPEETFSKWIGNEKKILLHAGGQSRRAGRHRDLFRHAACGEREQALSQL